MGVSVLVLTRNEEINIRRCLDSVAWSDDVVVFDSFSTDRTVEIARAAGARVVQRVFDDYGSHREAARTSVDYRYPWVLSIDADEMVDEQAVSEVCAAAADRTRAHVAYRLRRKDYFMGRWIRHSTLYPSWFVRLYRPDKVRYEARAVHEYPVADGTVGELKGHLIHNSFGKGIDEWFGKHIRYAGFEAAENLKSLRQGNANWADLLNFADPVRRRRAIKELSFRLPCRPTLRFLYMYLFRLGFLDGLPGFVYCRLLSMYEYMIVAKMKEIRRRERGLPRLRQTGAPSDPS